MLIIFGVVRYISGRRAAEMSLRNARPLRLLYTIAAHSGVKDYRGMNGTGVTAIAFSPDGRTLASGSNDKTAKLWDSQTGKLLKEIKHRLPVYDLALSPDGSTLATISGYSSPITDKYDESNLQLRDVRSAALLWRHISKKPISSPSFSADGKTLATATYGNVELRNAQTGALLKRLKGKSTGPFAFSPDGNLLTRGYRTNGLKNERIEVWDIQTGMIVQKLEPPRGLPKALLSAYREMKDVSSLVFLADNKTLVVGSAELDGGALRVWDVQTGSVLQTLPGYQRASVSAMALSPDGRLLAVASSTEGTIIIWDTQTWLAKWKTQESTHSLAFSSDGRMLASSSAGGNIKLWQLD